MAGSSPPDSHLTDGSRIVVIGGGPAGSFFAINLLRRAERRGLRPEVVILERRLGLTDPSSVSSHSGPGSCNYSRGGLSPPLNDALEELDLVLPDGVIQNRIRSITILSRWKNIELRVPDGRDLLCVYRGSRPRSRADRGLNFDSFLLARAREAGSDVRTAIVRGLDRDGGGRPVVRYVEPDGATETEVADFVVFAGGVNQVPGRDLDRDPLVRDIATLMPGFRPPRIRSTLIFEVELDRDDAASLEGELTFVLFGSRDLDLEMGSVMPKGRFATVVLIGPDIDSPRRQRRTEEVIRAFLELAHVRRILRRPMLASSVGCTCGPGMVVGPARRPFGDRIAVVGDMVTSRLYKDGLHSAYGSSSALVDALLSGGTSAKSLRRTYWPAIRALNADHRYGRMVFAATSLAFRRPALSRITYQAVLSERKTRTRPRRPLEAVLWRIASGDATYRSILAAMLSPATIRHFVVGGVLVTLRNYLTEMVFGLRWKGFGRFPTGIYKEDFDTRVAALDGRLRLGTADLPVRRMYTIRIRGPARRVFEELGRFGESDRSFFRPRHVVVRRTSGGPNEVGSVIRYGVTPRFLSFSIELVDRCEGRHLVYRVRDGFARGGVLVFDIEEHGRAECSLSILVAFRVRGTHGLPGFLLGIALRRFFPLYVHDVLWNHALCELRHAVESLSPSSRRTGTCDRTAAGGGTG